VTTDEEANRKRLGDSIITEMTTGTGISVHPAIVAVGHGYHPTTGGDQITFGSYDHKSQHLLTVVMPLELAREACELLAEQIARVDRLNAAQPNGDNNDD
jgi:predicted homoserine dehydrogenase-like protein